MKIINRITEQIYDIKNIDFNTGIIFGTSQSNVWSTESKELKILETDSTFKTIVEELTVNALLILPQYENYCKLTDYSNWDEYPNCVQRLFAKTEDIIWFTMNKPDFIVQMRMTEPINPIIEYSNGSLIYFFTQLSQEVINLMNTRNIIVENRPENTNLN